MPWAWLSRRKFLCPQSGLGAVLVWLGSKGWPGTVVLAAVLGAMGRPGCNSGGWVAASGLQILVILG